MTTLAKLGISRSGALCAALFLPLSACKLFGIEGEEIDFNDGETGATGYSSYSGDGDGDETSDEQGDGDPSTGDGDGDTGDGDGDAGDGDAGDGDGDSGDGDGDPGDGDGDDTGDGDGDGDHSCDVFLPQLLVDGENQVSIGNGGSQLEASCGAPGPESVYFYTASVDGDVQFAVTSGEIDVALYVLDECEPLTELACVADPDPLIIQQPMSQGETRYIVLDSFGVGGDAVIEVTVN
jgi:hypothetical protein